MALDTLANSQPSIPFAFPKHRKPCPASSFSRFLCRVHSVPGGLPWTGGPGRSRRTERRLLCWASCVLPHVPYLILLKSWEKPRFLSFHGEAVAHVGDSPEVRVSLLSRTPRCKLERESGRGRRAEGAWKSVEGVTCTGSGAQGWEKRGGGLAMF